MCQFLFFAAFYDNEFPGLLVVCGRRFIGCLKQYFYLIIRNFLTCECPDTMAVPDSFQCIIEGKS
jgi:hypothetical protein